ncbi:MAG: hypothetical protein GZ089_10045 [Aromatoleum sp.]|nr:hypothetical protein [Aromatoleum sp.]
MNRYEQTMYRPAFGIAAVAMTASVIGLTVVAPARMEAAGLQQPTVATAVRTPIETAVSPARIDVITLREQTAGFEPVRYVLPARKQAG